MGHLVLNKTLALKKAVISFWFRVPKETADAVDREAQAVFEDFRIFTGVVPLLVIGGQPTGGVYDFKPTVLGYLVSYDIFGNPHAIVPVHGGEWYGPRIVPMQPTSIGVGFQDDEAQPPKLIVHLQTADHGNAVATSFQKTGYVPTLNEEGYPINVDHFTYMDTSYTTTAAPEFLGNSNARSHNVYSEWNGPVVTFDAWHHVLISWDLLTDAVHGTYDAQANRIEFVDSYSKMWCALDDVNRTGMELPAMTVASLNSPYSGEGITDFDPNAMLCGTCWEYAGQLAGMEEGLDPKPFPLSSVSISYSGNLGNSIIIPSEVEYAASPGPPDGAGGQASPVKPLGRIEMAELQIFTGVTLDTAVEANRRAFIDYKRDEAGNPIPDKDGKLLLKPVDPKKAQELLGKRPDVLLHGTNNWKAGKNTGSLGMTEEGELIPSGQFVRSGTIVKYVPDPSVEPAA